jgi:hypothetical protein
MASIKESVQRAYNDIMLKNQGDGGNMEKKLYNYWVHSIEKGDKTLDDFKSFILKTPDYKNVVKSFFIDAFYDKLNDTDYHSLYDMFHQSFTGKIVGKKDVVDFICASDIFTQKYSSIICSMFDVLANRQPLDAELSYFLHQFSEDSDYTIDRMKEDILQEKYKEEHIKDPANVDVVSEKIWTEEEEVLLKDVDILSMIKQVLHLDDKTSIKNALTSPQNIETAENPKERMDLVDCFERVFGRSMFAREYIFYGKTFVDGDKSKTEQSFKDFKKQYDSMKNDVTVLLKEYLGKDITEQEIIKEYLENIHDADFAKVFENEIIASSEYSEKMKERLCSLYKHLYDEQLDSTDADYIFQSVKDKKCKLFDETLNNHIVEYKNYIDSLAERVLHLYMETYDREPDECEMSRYMRYYRSQQDTPQEKVEKTIVYELRDSLEYHDIVKDKIRKLYEKVIGNDRPQTSVMYKVLKQVLDGSHHQSDMLEDSIKKFLQTLVQ